jgi:hypothetical protein
LVHTPEEGFKHQSNNENQAHAVRKASENKKRHVFLDEDDLRNAIVGNEKNPEEIYEKLLDSGNIPKDDELSKLII